MSFNGTNNICNTADIISLYNNNLAKFYRYEGMLNKLCIKINNIVVDDIFNKINAVKIINKKIYFHNKKLSTDNIFMVLSHIPCTDLDLGEILYTYIIISKLAVIRYDDPDIPDFVIKRISVFKYNDDIISIIKLDLINHIFMYVRSVTNNNLRYIFSYIGRKNGRIYLYSFQNRHTRTVITYKNILNVLLNSGLYYSGSYEIYKIFVSMLDKSSFLDDAYYCFESLRTQSNFDLNPYLGTENKFLLIDKNIYLYNKNHCLIMLSDTINLKEIIYNNFPNFTQDSLKYLFGMLKKSDHLYKFKLTKTETLFNGFDFKAKYIDNTFNIYKINKPDVNQYYKLTDIYYKSLKTAEYYFDFIAGILGMYTQYNTDITDKLAILNAKCHLNCKTKDNFYIIYAPKNKNEIASFLKPFLSADMNNEFSLRGISKRKQLVKIQEMQMSSCVLLSEDEKLPGNYEYSYLDDIASGKRIIVRDRFLKKIYIENHLPIVYITENVSNIDTITKKLNRNVIIINFDAINKIDVIKFFSELKEKNANNPYYENIESAGNSLLDWMKTYFLMYGIILYKDKPKVKNIKLKDKIDENSVVMEFLNICCDLSVNDDIVFSDLYSAFTEFFNKKHNSNVIKRIQLRRILETMNMKYYRPHHNNKSNPYCIKGIKLKDNLSEIMQKLSNESTFSNNKLNRIAYLKYIEAISNIKIKFFDNTTFLLEDKYKKNK